MTTIRPKWEFYDTKLIHRNYKTQKMIGPDIVLQHVRTPQHNTINSYSKNKAAYTIQVSAAIIFSDIMSREDSS